MHARADGHETPKSVSLVPVGTGVGWIRQLLPSHRSASGSVTLESEAADEPTAVHARREEHATDDSTLTSAPTGSGVGSIVHVRPATAAVERPASAAPAVTIAVNPINTTTAPSSRTVRLQVATASPFLEEIQILLSGGSDPRLEASEEEFGAHLK
jgi:hypothetical protein